MKGKWRRGEGLSFLLETDNAVHAKVYFNDGWDDDRPWFVCIAHSEGNDCFATARDAKLHARKRLRKLLEDTEALR